MIELTAIVPVHKMGGRLSVLKEWVSEALSNGLTVVLIHDYGDLNTETELQKIVSDLQADRLFYISGIFNGPGAARNEGIFLVKTKYFCFWDSDDAPDVAGFVEMTKVAMGKNLEIVIGEFTTKRQDEITEHKFHQSDSKNLMQISLNPGIWRMIFSTESFKNHKFKNLKLAEDQLFLAETGFPEIEYELFHEAVYQYEVGVTGSLTSQRENFADLDLSIRVIEEIFKNANTRSRRKFLTILALRQSLTLLKNGQLSQSIRGLYVTMKFLIRMQIKNYSIGVK